MTIEDNGELVKTSKHKKKKIEGEKYQKKRKA